ncbi:FAD-binding oxidoreductase [Sphingomonas hankookensis]|uniref:FAD-binding oxidoreductase n=1 Tax=Sphingomonas hankookensis TaxID=563996 RepID=UPI003D301838
MVGGATPPADGSAVLLSLRRMDRIRQLAAGQAVVEAGVILQHLHEAAAGAGQRFPLTLGARGSATIGGLVSTNAGARRCCAGAICGGWCWAWRRCCPTGRCMRACACCPRTIAATT